MKTEKIKILVLMLKKQNLSPMLHGKLQEFVAHITTPFDSVLILEFRLVETHLSTQATQREK